MEAVIFEFVLGLSAVVGIGMMVSALMSSTDKDDKKISKPHVPSDANRIKINGLCYYFNPTGEMIGYVSKDGKWISGNDDPRSR